MTDTRSALDRDPILPDAERLAWLHELRRRMDIDRILRPEIEAVAQRPAMLPMDHLGDTNS